MSSNNVIQHKVTEAESYITVQLIGELTDAGLAAFTEESRRLVELDRPIIFNCEKLSGLDRKWVRLLVWTVQSLRKKNLEIRMIQVTKGVADFFRNEGVDGMIKSAPSLREALVSMGLVAPKAIDTEFINPFLLSTLKVLEIQTQTKATAGTVYVKKPGERLSGDISGVIGLVSEAFSGSVIISFPEKTFLAIISRMFGETYTSITKEIEDGAAELTNIIFGQAKIILNEKGYGIKTALPSVITGKDHNVASTIQGVTIVVPFSSDAGNFFVEISTTTI